ncbi:hypothetical protein O6H91_12G073400 [Diphasiastrum complanatum]|uniref:Uncharacterized protein n=1 Tax=Diphasiastrum complanatum TaxID=34168 RepID=A0ACC2C3S5_DIPCM|nr:hypothetical protein O6H91_12G073400 [Diphasiastrum complanatum]
MFLAPWIVHPLPLLCFLASPLVFLRVFGSMDRAQCKPLSSSCPLSRIHNSIDAKSFQNVLLLKAREDEDAELGPFLDFFGSNQ